VPLALLLEDADVAVASREDGNPTMSLMLNILDGVASSNKRIVVSTNLPNLNKIDEALIRPGRCHDVLTFRKLIVREAEAARAGAGLPFVDFSGRNDWTLSEVFNYDHVKSLDARKKSGMGY